MGWRTKLRVTYLDPEGNPLSLPALPQEMIAWGLKPPLGFSPSLLVLVEDTWRPMTPSFTATGPPFTISLPSLVGVESNERQEPSWCFARMGSGRVASTIVTGVITALLVLTAMAGC